TNDLCPTSTTTTSIEATTFPTTPPEHIIASNQQRRLLPRPLHPQDPLIDQSAPDNDYIRCTIFNEKGDMVQHGKEILKSLFIERYSLAARDFRKFDRNLKHSSTHTDIVPSIIIRKNSILVQLLNVHALIKYNELVIFDSFTHHPHHSSHTILHFLKDLGERLKSPHLESLPFEFKALEGILIHIVSNLSTEMKVHSTVLRNILQGLDDSIERYKLRYLLIEARRLLYLTDKAKGAPRLGNNHEEIEMLLENYYQTIDEIVQIVENLKNQIKTTEDLINVVLDSNRNQLMLLGLKFSTGFIIMRLLNFIEESDGGFEAVIVISAIALICLLLFGVKQVKKVEKVTMTSLHDKKK
ncbi:Mitochondrial inner membrane magnesium transporter LPE10, partial [Candida viswanathii]